MIKLSRTMQKYLVIGVSVYVFEMAVIVAAQFFGASAVVAVAISYISGMLVSFALQKFVTFGDKRRHFKIVFRQAAAVTCLVGWNLVFTLIVVSLTHAWLPAVIARTVALAITTIWNFYLYKTHIFRAPVVT